MHNANCSGSGRQTDAALMSLRVSTWKTGLAAMALLCLGACSSSRDEAPVAAAAPQAGIPADVAQALREIGPQIDGARTSALYAPLHAGRTHPGVEVQREQAYGPDPKHRADVFTPRDAGSAGKPILVYAYGGGFRGAYRNAPDSPFYDNIGYWAAENGLVGVTIQYRLAPEVGWPAGAEDIARVVDWVRAHAAEWGGDASKVILWGHSSGAAHVADYLARTPETPVKAAILMSGIYDLTNPEAAMWSHYYGEEAAQYAARSSLPRLVTLPLPMMVVWAELDPPTFLPDTEQLVQGRRDGGLPVVALQLPGHSHLSEAYSIGTEDTTLSEPVLQFIRAQANGDPAPAR